MARTDPQPAQSKRDRRLVGRYLKMLAKVHGVPEPNRFTPSAQAGFSVIERARRWDRTGRGR